MLQKKSQEAAEESAVEKGMEKAMQKSVEEKAMQKSVEKAMQKSVEKDMQKEAAKATTTLIEISVDGSSPMVPMRRALAMSSPFAEGSHQLSAFGAERVGPGTSFRSNFLLGISSPQVPSSSGSKMRTMASTSSGPPDMGQKLQTEMDKDSNQFGFAIVIEEDGIRENLSEMH